MITHRELTEIADTCRRLEGSSCSEISLGDIEIIDGNGEQLGLIAQNASKEWAFYPSKESTDRA